MVDKSNQASDQKRWWSTLPTWQAIAAILGGVGSFLAAVVALAVFLSSSDGAPPVASPSPAASSLEGKTPGSSPAPAATSPSLREIPPAFEDTGCFYDVHADNRRGAEAHQILDEGRVDQQFVAVYPFVWSMTVVIGHDPSRTPDPVEIALLNSDGQELYSNTATIADNAGTEVRFAPVEVIPGETYTLRLINTSGRTLGVYMYAETSPDGSKHKPTATGTTLVYGEERRPDGQRTEAVSACIGGATRN